LHLKTLERALLFAGTFLRAAAERGWHPVPPAEPEPPPFAYSRAPDPAPAGPQFAQLDIDGKRIQFQIEERYERRELPPTTADLSEQKRDPASVPRDAPRPCVLNDYVSNVHDLTTGVTWTERAGSKRRPALRRSSSHAFWPTSVQSRRERERQEEERQEMLRKELAQRREANQALIHALETQAGAWHRAKFLRRYLRVARRTMGSRSVIVELQDQPSDFLDWAEHYVDQLDPLTLRAHDPDRTPARS